MTTDWHLTEFQFQLWDLYQSKKKKQKQPSKTRPENVQQAHRRKPTLERDLIKATLRLCWDRIPARALPPQIHCTPPEHPTEKHLRTATAEKNKRENLKAKDIPKQTWVTRTNCTWNFINLRIRYCRLCQYHIGNTFFWCFDCLVLQYLNFAQLRSPETQESQSPCFCCH